MVPELYMVPQAEVYSNTSAGSGVGEVISITTLSAELLVVNVKKVMGELFVLLVQTTEVLVEDEVE